MNQFDCTGDRNLGEILARPPAILPYYSRPVTNAFGYARRYSVIPLGRSESPLSLSRKFAFGERVAK